MATENWVAKLNEYVQPRRLKLRYEDVRSVGPDHIKTFTVRVVLNGKEYPEGVGHNKKEAKQNAAKNAMTALSEKSSDCTENAEAVRPAPVHQTSIHNYVCWLNEYGNKNKVLIKATESTSLDPSGAQCCSFVVGDKEYPAGYGKTKKEAKEEAAKLAYQEILDSTSTHSGHEPYGGTPRQQKEESEQNVSEICDKMNSLSVKPEGENFVGLINQYCQKRKWDCDYILVERCGEAHSPLFSYKLLINNKEYSVGKGKNVKEAKQNAAQQAWAVLKQQPDCDSKVHFLSSVSADGEARLRTLPNTPEFDNAHMELKPKATTGDSAVFTTSLTPSKNQDQSPDVRPRIRLAAKFERAGNHSMEDMPNFKRGEGTPHSQSSSRFKSDFDCIEQIGKGAFGRVYKAREKLLDKNYAVKIVRYKEKTLREVAALSDLHHPNIVRYYKCWMEDSGYQMESVADSSSASHLTGGSSGEHLCIQMELCNTKTLRVWIDEKNSETGQMSLCDSKRREKRPTIVQQLTSGVEYIHSKKFIHRDLKPANILFGQDEEVKIGDFGLVTAENDDDAENLIERTEYKGTPSYMAPEQKSRSTYDRKVDIFALGLIYFELLWNFRAKDKQIWDDARNQRLPQDFSHEYPQESQMIKSMLCFKPQERPEASQLRKDLEEYSHRLKNICDERQTV
ncbi:interferon-induced, double-stranded RNA-activated protein kinase-like [Solea solea]|uniref:interferon-induced, double-stranded RNA-activated protein kinase-like n=1 Tax=Solea solea TaxID=90069 RepID=UPI00272CD6C0|nr:interferon-induced, double-stranded RNA-activated protein kinase-like [Solea solea]